MDLARNFTREFLGYNGGYAAARGEYSSPSLPRRGPSAVLPWECFDLSWSQEVAAAGYMSVVHQCWLSFL